MIASLQTDGQTTLPVPPNRLLGREQDLATLATFLVEDRPRLVTLTGPGGVGKTHLALELAGQVAATYTAGVVFVPLASVREPDLVLPAIAQAIGIRERPGQVLIEALGSALSGQDMLVVLDNLEQIMEAAPDIGVLLAATTGPQFLATSRSPLHLRAEREYPVAPLALPDSNQTPTAASISDNAAVTLFVDRSRAAQPSFTLTDDNAAAIVEICRHLDGLPLAIEITAAMTRILTPQGLLSRMERRLHLQLAGATDLPDRQRTLRDTIAWSVDLLGPAEHQLFRRLSVFSRQASLEAIEAVCGDPGGADVLSIVTSLVDKSLLRRLDSKQVAGINDEEPTFRMLTTIREYATELLDSRDEGHEIRKRHLEWMLDLATRAEQGMLGSEQALWIRRLDDEHDNVRAALTWALGECLEGGMRLASKLWRYWATRSLLTEGHTWINRFLTAPHETDAAVRANAFNSLGNLSIDLGDYPGAASAYMQALSIWEQLGDIRGIANTLNGLGLVDWYQGEYQSARVRHERSLELRRGFGDRFGEANSLTNLGNVIKDLGDVPAARDLHEQALAIRQDLGDRAGVGYSYINLADCARRTGDHHEARIMYGKSLDAFQDVGDTLGLGYARHGLGLATYLSGDNLAAIHHYMDGLLIRSGLGDRRGVIECIEGVASIAAAADHETKQVAVTLFGASWVLREQIGAPPPEPDRLLYGPIVEGLRDVMPADTFNDRWTTGTRLSLPETVTMATGIARAMTSAPEPAVRPESVRGGLSEREIEVVALVASGLTNSQVADRLFLSRRTVDAHLRRIYDKLELSSRTEVVRYAIEHGLTNTAST